MAVRPRSQAAEWDCLAPTGPRSAGSRPPLDSCMRRQHLAGPPRDGGAGGRWCEAVEGGASRRSGGGKALNFEDLSREQLLRLLVKRDTERRLGLVWERDEIEHDAALNGDFVAMDLDRGASAGAGPWSNLLIAGENFDALRWLRMTHNGRVRLIYIDPPYNTGNRDWVYNDRFVSKDDGFRHSQWLEFMHRRLVLARDLLAPDGAIFVSIDDNEGPYLKALMDDVFRPERFVTSFIWRKVDSPNDNKVKVAPDHEYIHCYASGEALARWRRLSAASILEAFTQTDERGRLYRDRLLRKNGKSSLRSDRPTMFFALIAPDGTEVWPIREDGQDGRWSHARQGVTKAENEGRLIWKRISDASGVPFWIPYVREFAPEVAERPFPSIWADVMTTRQAKAHHADMFPGEEPFVTPKPEQLLARIIGMATEPGDVVADFFLGSATTAAVATKMGRRWIGVERDPAIAEYARRRLAKVAEGESGGVSEAVGWDGGPVAFARLSPRRIRFEDLAYDLEPEQVWLAVQAMHRLPLSPLPPGADFQVAAGGGRAVAYCDRFTAAAEAGLRAAAAEHPFLVVYAHTPRPVRDAIGPSDRVEVRAVPDHLIQRFQG